MKHSEQHPLLDEFLTGQEVAGFREASLRRGLMALHRTRQRRNIVRGVAFVVLPALVASLILLKRSENAPSPDAPVAASGIASAPEQPRPSSIEFISDDELLFCS